MKRNTYRLFIILAGLVLAGGCASHQSSLHSTKERKMTLGVVQKEIRVGMSQADVAMALGSPNIVTRDSDGKETWVYDKIATEASYSKSSGDISGAAGAGGIAGSSLLLGGVVGGGASRSSGASSTTQRTLTVIIKYDKNSLVETFSYHMSKF